MIGWNDNFTGFDAPPPYPSAKLEAWSETANMLFAAGCEPQAFALLSSFAAPLMVLFPTSEGGAVVSIHGGPARASRWRWLRRRRCGACRQNSTSAVAGSSAS